LKNTRIQKRIIKLFLVFSFTCPHSYGKQKIDNIPPYGYVFKKWGGPPIDVINYFPPSASRDSPVLIIIPDGKRDVQLSHSKWIEIAKKEKVILVAIGARKKYFPDDYSYSSGRVISREGHALHKDQWLFSAIEPLFTDFKSNNNLTQDKFYLVGENEGAGFVHRYLLFNPKGPVLKALAINPDFVTVPDKNISYPFGLKNSPVSNQNIKEWLSCDLTLVSTPEREVFQKKSLSNSPIAAIQGDSRNKRGEFLFNFTKIFAAKNKLNMNWSFKKLIRTEESKALKKQLFNLLIKE
jgi:hypothetical protein